MIALPDAIAAALESSELDALSDTLRGFPRYLQVRGSEYARGGRVWDTTAVDGGFHSRVQGTRAYATRWHLDVGRWTPRCSCPSGPWCKHAFAAGLFVLAAARHAGRFTSDAHDALFSTDWLPAPGGAAADAAASPSTSRRARTPLQTLREGQSWERQHVAQRFLREAGLEAFVLPGTVLQEIVGESDPDLRCLRMARAIAARARDAVPTELEPFLRNATLLTRLEELERREVLDSLDRWSRTGTETPRRLRLVLGLVEDEDGLAVTMQARLTAPRLVDEPRTASQLDQLANELRRDVTLLTPPQIRSSPDGCMPENRRGRGATVMVEVR